LSGTKGEKIAGVSGRYIEGVKEKAQIKKGGESKRMERDNLDKSH